MDFWKAITTLGIWLSIVAITIVLNVTGNSMGWLVSMAAMAFAFIITLQIWDKNRTLTGNVHVAESSEKAKRSTDPDAKMRMVLEMMDEDERYAFKQAMKERMLSGSRDGELNYDADSLGALLDEDERYRRKR